MSGDIPDMGQMVHERAEKNLINPVSDSDKVPVLSGFDILEPHGKLSKGHDFTYRTPKSGSR